MYSVTQNGESSGIKDKTTCFETPLDTNNHTVNHRQKGNTIYVYKYDKQYENVFIIINTMDCCDNGSTTTDEDDGDVW
jgi:hypothetical protein